MCVLFSTLRLRRKGKVVGEILYEKLNLYDFEMWTFHWLFNGFICPALLPLVTLNMQSNANHFDSVNYSSELCTFSAKWSTIILITRRCFPLTQKQYGKHQKSHSSINKTASVEHKYLVTTGVQGKPTINKDKLYYVFHVASHKFRIMTICLTQTRLDTNVIIKRK